ncbi:MAG: S-layer family protein, partial [Cyanobacteriota bacterium]|nr:S-layer family protein [Cyanobacteriota bacterium]
GGKITLTSGGTLSASGLVVGTSTFGSDPGNDLVINARSLQVENVSVSAQTRGDGRSGNIRIDTAEEVIIRNASISTDSEGGSGDAGDFFLNTRRLSIIKEVGTTYPFDVGLGTDADESSTGNGGNVTINASESIEIIGDRPGPFVLTPNGFIDILLQVARTNQTTGTTFAGISTAAFGGGNSGSATLNTGRFLLRDGVGIITFPDNRNGPAGRGGDLTVNATEIFAQGQAGLGTGTFGQRAGDLTVTADRITLTDGAAMGAATDSDEGDAGNVALSVRDLRVLNGSALGASTNKAGNGGNLTISGAERVEVAGTSIDGSFASAIRSDSLGMGNAGAIAIAADRLLVRDGGEIATNTINGGAGGDIDLEIRALQVDNGLINASTATAERGGDIRIRATDSVEVNGAGFNALQEQFIAPAFAGTLNLSNFNQGIVTVSAGEGAAGTVSIETANFTARNGGSIATTALAQGRGGEISIRARETIALDNALLGTGTFQDADSGNIALTARKLTATGGAQAFTTTFGSGRAGNLTANIAESIDLIGPFGEGFASGLFASSAQTASGEGGDLAIATGQLRLLEGAAISVSAEGTGDAGDINIDARSLFLENSAIAATSNATAGGNINLVLSESSQLRDRSRLSTATREGVAGRLTLRAGNSVWVENSEIASSATGNGTAGAIDLSAGRLTLRDRATLAVSSAGRGDAGNLQVRANQIALENSTISAETNAGSRGNIAISTKDSLALERNSRISAATVEGRGGTVNLQVGGTLELAQDSQITAAATGRFGLAGDLQLRATRTELRDRSRLEATTQSGDGGNIDLAIADLLLLRNNSSISTTAGVAGAGGNGGNIDIQAGIVLGFPQENSDITANAFEGRGGNITITTNAIYGLQFRPRLTPLSDITASSEFGLNGQFILNLLSFPAERGLNSLPTDLLDPSDLIATGCLADRDASFVLTGRGGLPADPRQVLRGRVVVQDWRVIADSGSPAPSARTEFPSPTEPPPVEARGWWVNEQGNIELIHDSEVLSRKNERDRLFCQAPLPSH